MQKSIQQINEELSLVAEDETIEVNLRQLLFIYKAIEEWRYYFHNQEYYPTIEELRGFVGNKKQGMYAVLDHIYFKVLHEMLPQGFEDRL